MESSSYEFSSFEDGTGELLRLKDQAGVAANLESSLLKSSGLAGAGKVLELGCGPGFVTSILADAAPGSEVLAVDYSEELLGELNRGLSDEKRRRIHAVRCDGAAVPVPSGWSDFIYARFLLQHVAEPGAIIAEAQRVSASGGVFCAVDSDDGLLIQYPEDGFICGLLKKAEQRQAEIGGDRRIGRKLPVMLREAGFQDVSVKVVHLTPNDIPFTLLLGMGLGYKAELVGMKSELDEAIVRLENEYNEGRYFFSTGIFVVTGRKA